MNHHKNMTNRELFEMLVDQFQQVYVAVTDMSVRLTALEIKVDYLADRQNEMFLELKAHNKKLNNHELRITKLETA